MQRILTHALPLVAALLALVPAAAVRASGGETKALLGDRAVEANTSSLLAGHAQAFSFRVDRAGVAGAVHVYLDASNSARVLLVGLYGSGHGHPGALLTRGVARALHAGAWNEVPLSPTRLQPSTRYWLAVLGGHGTLRYRVRAHGRCRSEIPAHAASRGLDHHWRTSRVYSVCPISAFVTAAAMADGFGAPVQSLAPSTPALAEAIATPPPSGSTPAPEGSETTTPTREPPPPPSPVAPGVIVVPIVTGAAVAGHTLVASRGSWTGTQPIVFSYRWQECSIGGQACADIAGATSSEYALTDADVGHIVRAVVSASNAVGSTQAASAVTGLVGSREQYSCATTLDEAYAERGGNSAGDRRCR